jgi:hypothetical protein
MADIGVQRELVRRQRDAAVGDAGGRFWIRFRFSFITGKAVEVDPSGPLSRICMASGARRWGA